MKQCELCSREVDDTSEHHLVPRSRRSNRRVKKLFTSEEKQKTVGLCQPCHSNIHATFTEKELSLKYNSLSTLLEHPQIKGFVKWVRKRPPAFRTKSDRWHDR